MITQEQVTVVLKGLPGKFDADELIVKLLFLEKLNDAIRQGERGETYSTEEARELLDIPPRPANLKPEEAAEWDYYTSPAALALYAKFPVSPEVRALRGIAANLSPEDLKKSAKEWRAEAIEAKYGR